MDYDEDPSFMFDEQPYEEDPNFLNEEEEQETARQTEFAMSDEFDELNNLDTSSVGNEYSEKAITLLASSRPAHSEVTNNSSRTAQSGRVVDNKASYLTTKQSLT
jgi:hypothetical protein